MLHEHERLCVLFFLSSVKKYLFTSGSNRPTAAVDQGPIQVVVAKVTLCSNGLAGE